MAEKRVRYQVDGRPFEGAIVYDDTVKAKRPIVFMQPDWKGVCADTIAQARSVAGDDYVVLIADMFGAGYGDTTKSREQLAVGMKAVHNDLAFTIACGTAAYDAPRTNDYVSVLKEVSSTSLNSARGNDVLALAYPGASLINAHQDERGKDCKNP